MRFLQIPKVATPKAPSVPKTPQAATISLFVVRAFFSSNFLKYSNSSFKKSAQITQAWLFNVDDTDDRDPQKSEPRKKPLKPINMLIKKILY